MCKNLNDKFVDANVEPLMCNRFNVDEYLYEQNSTFCHDDAARNFD